MSSVFTMSSSGPPAGHHPVEFVGISPFESDNEKTSGYGPAVSLLFRVTEGSHADEEIFVVCSKKLTSRSKLATYAVALNGGAIAMGQTVDFDSFIGTKGILVVDQDAEGATKPSSFLKTS